MLVDIEPGTLKSVLSVLSDHWITGDRHVSLLPAAEATSALAGTFPEVAEVGGIRQVVVDRPNYCVSVICSVPVRYGLLSGKNAPAQGHEAHERAE